MVRKKSSDTQKERLLQKNAYVCCVCKQRGLGLHLHHIDGNKSNNNIENLEIKSRGEHNSIHFSGENNAWAKLTEENVIEIKRMLRAGVLNQTEIGKVFGVGSGAINHIATGRNWKNVQ